MAERVSIAPTSVEQDGPGIDLASLPDGISVKMSDPNPNLAYARNMVTLHYDLLGFENVVLGFEARESGEEPHAPNSELGIENSENLVGFGPVVDFDFDGVGTRSTRFSASGT